MYDSTEVLRSFARVVKQVSGAETVSVFVPPAPREPGGALLLHEGRLPPVPELANLAAAGALGRREGGPGGGDGLFLSSRDPDCRLLPLPVLEILLADVIARPAPPGGHQRRRRTDVASAAPGPAWIGLRYAGGVAPSTRLGDSDGSRILALGAALAWHGQQVSTLPSDPLTGLPSRVAFQFNLGRTMERATTTARPLTLLLVNPDGLADVNERFGREAGDVVVKEIADRLRVCLRSSDFVGKYGGAVFAAILTNTPEATGRNVAEKVLGTLTEGAYLEGALRLGFGAGLAVFEPDDGAGTEAPLELIRRADQALHAAKREGDGRVAVWDQAAGGEEEPGNLDRLSGIFTANMAKDYRNMVLLWDTVSVIAGSTDFAGLANQAVERLHATLKPRWVGLFRWSEEGDPELVRGLGQPGAPDQDPSRPLRPGRAQRALLWQARTQRKVATAEDGAGGSSYAVPLIAGDDCLGCLFLCGNRDTFTLDSSDLIFLGALAGQLAVAFDRARLAEHERTRLRSELKELRQALQESRLLYCSPQMDKVITTVRRVAPSDVTVLISGESGTGKELMARTIHELSPRRTKPLIIVDCGAIAEALIDSELFGHERGAYTGAEQRRLGRLAGADGGTLLLDEIGELPLEVQSKLLRFVQERQFTPVGGTRPMSVDVRVIAATNRELSAEVKAGRFREDLYYRLNVVHLVVPPLRERRDDILYLATHWLEKYSIQYQKPLRRLSPEAETRLLQHPWYGNVRELQNRILQAVLLSEGEALEGEALRLGDPQPPRGDASAPDSLWPGQAGPLEIGVDRCPQVEVSSVDEAWRSLRRALGEQIEAVAAPGGAQPVPLGKWLSEDMVLEAYAAAGGLLKGGAAILGVPRTTFRRRLRSAQAASRAGLSPRSAEWQRTRALLSGLVRQGNAGEENYLRRAQGILLDEICKRLPEPTQLGSALAGVTPETFQRWQAGLQPDRKTGR